MFIDFLSQLWHAEDLDPFGGGMIQQFNFLLVAEFNLCVACDSCKMPADGMEQNVQLASCYASGITRGSQRKLQMFLSLKSLCTNEVCR